MKIKDQDEPILEREHEDNDCKQEFNAKFLGKNICAKYLCKFLKLWCEDCVYF